MKRKHKPKQLPGELLNRVSDADIKLLIEIANRKLGNGVKESVRLKASEFSAMQHSQLALLAADQWVKDAMVEMSLRALLTMALAAHDLSTESFKEMLRLWRKQPLLREHQLKAAQAKRAEQQHKRIRKAIDKLHKEGKSPREVCALVAENMRISPRTVRRVRGEKKLHSKRT